MRDELPGDEMKNIWKDQPTEVSPMMMKLIRSRAQQLKAGTRKKLIGITTGPVMVVVLHALAASQFPPLRHQLNPWFAAALIWSLLGLYFVTRGMWSPVLPGDAGLSTGLEFCRDELERRQSLLRRGLWWSWSPKMLALSIFIWGLAMIGRPERLLIPNGLPFLSLVVVWIFAYFIMRSRELRELRREIEELKELESDNVREH